MWYFKKINMKKTKYKHPTLLQKTAELEKKYRKKIVIYLDIVGIKDFTKKNQW
ncbi:MAG: hypothetical protein ACJAZX_000606 [Rickettsiales bacterium]|jgi:hypothetical protein